MKRLPFVLMLLIATPVISQDTLSLKDLVDIYLLKDGEEAVKRLDVKGYKKAGTEEVRKMYNASAMDRDNYIVLSRNAESSRVGLTFYNDKISSISYRDSLRVVITLLDQLRKTGLDLVNKEGNMSEVYTTKRLSYFIWYERISGEEKTNAVISVLPKHKGYENLYKPKKKKVNR